MKAAIRQSPDSENAAKFTPGGGSIDIHTSNDEKGRILHVEDHPATQKVISMQLRRAGYEVRTAGCVHEAPEIAEKEQSHAPSLEHEPDRATQQTLMRADVFKFPSRYTHR